MRLNKLKKILLWLLLTPVVLIASAVVYYQFDEALRPEVVAVLNHKPAPVPEEQNGYYPLLGLFAPADVAPRQKGLAIMAETKKRHEEKALAPWSVSDVRDAQAISPKLGSLKVCEDNKVSHCLRDVRKNKAAYKTLVADNQLLLTRYREVHHHPEFQETTPHFFGYSDIIKMNRLAQSDIALKWDAKNYQQALTLLRNEHHFWRRVVSSEVSLLGRMIGLAILQRNLNLALELMSDCSDCIIDQTIMLDILTPTAPAELSVRKVFAYESRFIYDILNTGVMDIENDLPLGNVLSSLAFKKNSAANKIVNIHDHVIRLSECPLEQYTSCYRECKKYTHRELDYLSLEFLDDPVGKILAEITTPAYKDYVFAAIQHEALRRLVLAKYYLGKNAIKPDAIENYLQTHNQEFGNPVTGKPIEWDAKQRLLKMSFPAEIEQPAIEVSL